jgi:hypothetical protein
MTWDLPGKVHIVEICNTMRFLILNTDYPEFLSWLYAQHPGLEKQPYEEQMRARNESRESGTRHDAYDPYHSFRLRPT